MVIVLFPYFPLPHTTYPNNVNPLHEHIIDKDCKSRYTINSQLYVLAKAIALDFVHHKEYVLVFVHSATRQIIPGIAISITRY